MLPLYSFGLTRARKTPRKSTSASVFIRGTSLRRQFFITDRQKISPSLPDCSSIGTFTSCESWVADWIQGDANPWAPPVVGTTNATYGNDLVIGVNPAQTQGSGKGFPAALERGGSFNFGNRADAGVFALSASQSASSSFNDLGFRCAR